jgi:FKBP-type peptidyl-prolyl cis-trans isomerase FklB
MKFVGLSLFLLLAMAMQVRAQEDLPAQTAPQTLLEKVAYGVGLGLGRNLAADDIQLDLNWLVKGVQDGMDKTSKPLLTDEEYQATMNEFQKQMQVKQQAAAQAAGEKNKADGAAFLAANAKKQGVVTTKSGLQYQVIKRGTGATPKATDTVKVHYHGTLLDGTVFDSSVQREEPAQFPVNRVIPGWTEALQLMKVGDKFRLFIPSNLAYGERGAGGDIGPNATLVFDVELLDIPQ